MQSSVAVVAEDPHMTLRPFGLTLCHGLGGTVELLAAANEVLGPDEHLKTARWLVESAVQTLGDDVETWSTCIEDALWAPGLMTGLAGTLLVLLRVAFPRRVPGVGLLLA